MSSEDDRWRLPALEKFGAQLRDAESAERSAARTPHRRPFISGRWATAAAVGAIAVVAVVLEIVSPAGARSPVNGAPVAAERSRSVRFTSTQVITLNGHRVTGVRESGKLDFVTGAFATRLTVGDTHEPIERRRVGDTLYVRQVPADRAPAGRTGWSVIHVGRSSLGSFSLPGGYTLIDPQVVFRVLTDARSPVTVVGHERLNGALTTHYRLATSLEAFLAAEQGQSARGLPNANRGATLDIWLDMQGRPVRVKSTFLGSSRLGAAKMTTVVDFAGYGLPVTVQAPPSVAISPPGVRTPPLGDPARVAEHVLSLGR